MPTRVLWQARAMLCQVLSSKLSQQGRKGKFPSDVPCHRHRWRQRATAPQCLFPLPSLVAVFRCSSSPDCPPSCSPRDCPSRTSEQWRVSWALKSRPWQCQRSGRCALEEVPRADENSRRLLGQAGVVVQFSGFQTMRCGRSVVTAWVIFAHVFLHCWFPCQTTW